MTQKKIETTIGMCIVALTRHIMKKQNLNYEEAYRTLLQTELYQLLSDEETRLFLEPNTFLCDAYDREVSLGRNGLYEFIR